MNKQLHLEAIRGIASLIVVFAHFAAAFYPSTLFGISYQSHASWESVFTETPLGIVFAGYFAVCIFFVLSGYVLSLPYFGESSKDTIHLLTALLKRPFRLGGLVFISIFLSFGIYHCGGYFNVPVSSQSLSVPWFQDYFADDVFSFQNLTPRRIVENLIGCNPPLWTLKVELIGSILTFVFLLLVRKSKWRVFAYVLTMAALHGTLYQGFMFGILMADISRNHPGALNRFSHPFFLWPLLAVGLLISSYPAYLDDVALAATSYAALPDTLLGVRCSMVGALLVFLCVLLNLRLQVFLSNRVFVFLGRISFSMYAIHFLVLASFSSWLFLILRPTLNYHATLGVVAGLSMIFLTGLAYLLTLYVDEPITRTVNRLAKAWVGRSLYSTTSDAREQSTM